MNLTRFHGLGCHSRDSLLIINPGGAEMSDTLLAARDRGPVSLQEQGEDDGRRHAIEERLESRLIMFECPFRRRRWHASGAGSEYGTQKCGKAKVDEIDDTGRGAAVLGPVGLLDNRIRNVWRRRRRCLPPGPG